MMTDPLFARAQLAIQENAALRAQRRVIANRHDEEARHLRREILESAMLRAEIKAYRDNSE
jgi:hypothetical protein